MTKFENKFELGAIVTLFVAVATAAWFIGGQTSTVNDLEQREQKRTEAIKELQEAINGLKEQPRTPSLALEAVNEEIFIGFPSSGKKVFRQLSKTAHACFFTRISAQLAGKDPLLEILYDKNSGWSLTGRLYKENTNKKADHNVAVRCIEFKVRN